MVEKLYRNNDYMIAWNRRERTRLEVGRWPDNTGWSEPYLFTTGCCGLGFEELPETEQAQRLRNQAFVLIVAYRVPVQDVLREFSKIGVWCDIGITLPGGGYQKAFAPDALSKLTPHNPS